MKWNLPWAAIHKVSSILCLIFVPVWLISLFFCFMYFALRLPTGDMTGWMQAAGSVGAIGVAIYIANAQQVAERNRLRERRQILKMVLSDVARRCIVQVRNIEERLRRTSEHPDPDIFRVVGEAYSDSLEKVLAELKGVDVAELGDKRIAKHVLGLRGLLEEVFFRLPVLRPNVSAITRIYASADVMELLHETVYSAEFLRSACE